MSASYEHVAKVLANETFKRRGVVVLLFVVINLAAVGVGLIWPKSYTSSTTIYVEEKGIIQPLMQGAAVATDVKDRARIAREQIYGRKFMNEVLQRSGFLDNKMSDVEKEQLFESVKLRAKVLNVGQNLIRIEYSDSDADRAFKTLQNVADLFVNESVDTQSHESQSAFEFIDTQVKEYHTKLTSAEQALKEFRSQNVDARPGTEAEVAGRMNALQATIEKTSLELKEAQIKKTSIEKQLSGEAEVSASLTRAGQYMTRVADLQSQLDTLRLSYHDTYPDIVRIKHQIEDIKEVVANENRQLEARQRAAENAPTGTSAKPYVDDNSRVNPLYQQLRRELYETKILLETLSTRSVETKNLLKSELDRARRVHGGEAVFAELTRDYEVNRDIYQDLLRRRETARVSKNLDRDQRGSSLKIYEPAFMPLQPTGLRFMHFVFGGIMLGVLIPPGLLLALQQLDPRIRFQYLISEKLKLPVLATVPHLTTPTEAVEITRGIKWLMFVVFITLGFVFTVSFLKLMGAL